MRTLLIIACTALLAGCGNSHVKTVDAFRDASDRGDQDTMRAYLSDDPRIWYGERTGDGSPWRPGGGEGRWKGWDDHFNGTSDVGDWRVDGDRVWAVVWEMNDYFRMCEAGPSAWTLTYFLDADGRIEGTMVSSAPDGIEGDSGRRQEFDAWLKASRPEAYEYLRPGGKIDPTGDRPMRTREMLHEWRREVGLPEIE